MLSGTELEKWAENRENGPRNGAIKSRKGYSDRRKVNTYVKGLRWLAASETGRQTSSRLCLSAAQTRRKGWRINEQKAVTSAAGASVPVLTGEGSKTGKCVGSSASPWVGHAAKCKNVFPNKDFTSAIDSVRQIRVPYFFQGESKQRF